MFCREMDSQLLLAVAKEMPSLRKALLFAMRAAVLAPALLGVLLLSAPAESMHERNHISRYRNGICETNGDCRPGEICRSERNRQWEERRFCIVDIEWDSDEDGIPDGSDGIRRDNCPTTTNPDQKDFDLDGYGDQCDDDIDNDGVPNGMDNCPFYYNPVQKDSDETKPQCDLQVGAMVRGRNNGCIYKKSLPYPRFCHYRAPLR